VQDDRHSVIGFLLDLLQSASVDRSAKDQFDGMKVAMAYLS
jgi:hypothetical protein